MKLLIYLLIDELSAAMLYIFPNSLVDTLKHVHTLTRTQF